MAIVLLVTGGRDFPVEHAGWFNRYMDELFDEVGFKVIVEGGARGVDGLAKAWGKKRGVFVATVDALWDFHGNAAGPLRNAAMLLLRPDLVIAFPGGKGTANMVRLAEREGITVRHAAPPDTS